MTPAVAAGVAKQVWTIANLVAMMERLEESLALAMLVTRYGSVDYLFLLMLCAMLLTFTALLIQRVSKTKESN
jgi:hypothetical protein